MDTKILERYKKSQQEKCIYFVKTKNGNMYWSYTSVPQYEITLAKDFINWLNDCTLCHNFNGVGFIEEVLNSEIDFYLNVTDEANTYNININDIVIKDFIEGFTDLRRDNEQSSCVFQLRWFFKEYMTHKSIT